MNRGVKIAVKQMFRQIKSILGDNLLAVYLYGSCVLGDFRRGWSDIDMLALTKNPIGDDQANKLLYLRQEALKVNPENRFFRHFEGAILSIDSFLNGENGNIVYWGTKGEKIKQTYQLDSFSIKILLEKGVLLYGKDVRNQFKKPQYEQLFEDIKHHYQTIRQHGQQPSASVYSFGWMLDISRCLFTLITGEIASKTKAGQWALRNRLCPDEEDLKKVLKIRKNPVKYLNKPEIMDYAKTIAPAIKRYADVLEQHILQIERKQK